MTVFNHELVTGVDVMGDLKNRSDFTLRPNSCLRPNLQKFVK